MNLEIWDNQIPPRANPQEAEEELDHPLVDLQEEVVEVGVVDLVEVEEDYRVVEYLDDTIVVRGRIAPQDHHSPEARERSDPPTSSLVTEPRPMDSWMTFGSFSLEIPPDSQIVM